MEDFLSGKIKKKAILVSEGATFMSSIIKDAMKEANFDVVSIRPILDEVRANVHVSNIIVVYLGEHIASSQEALSYIAEVVSQKEKELVIIGFKNELSLIYSLVPTLQVLAKELLRPLNAKDIIAYLQKVSSQMSSFYVKKKILVVDDDGVFLRTVHDWLSSKYSVSVVSSGVNAIKYLATNTPDLILLDFEMPVTDGPQILKMIRSEPSTQNIPVMFLTAKSDKDSVMTGISSKPDGYLLKTMTSDEIIRSVDEFFAKEKKAKKKEDDFWDF
ncbi:Response regulator receiver domain-containing protein [Acetitomaculum ruminis DSM 5522]|uniref:Stage 0 sporulation protein A homolog n=1 Tax=Acetitomaculum ruminis DSM 5522 TaxID=1120918 RepID=A0A1I1AKT0_9FIRM|nr:response regulator [Acetitomaculum ruminis]SFB38614.1 Response regulator receiver domain-containing protein [Acetitomaculum ruminis DSM 5522]